MGAQIGPLIGQIFPICECSTTLKSIYLNCKNNLYSTSSDPVLRTGLEHSIN